MATHVQFKLNDEELAGLMSNAADGESPGLVAKRVLLEAVMGGSRPKSAARSAAALKVEGKAAKMAAKGKNWEPPLTPAYVEPDDSPVIGVPWAQG